MRINAKNKLMSLYLMFGMVLFVIGFSYAFFIYNKTGLYTHTITGGKMKVIYDETSGNNILIENAYPRTDKEALTYGLEFEFTITGYNESEKNVYYAIEMDYGDDLDGKNRFLDTDIKLSLYENDEEIFENEIFENLDNQDIHYSYFEKGTNSQTPTINNYKIRLWINDNVIISDTLKEDLNAWSDFEWEWFNRRYDSMEEVADAVYNACPSFYLGDSEECTLTDFGINVYTTEEFSNSYANFKVNIKADLNFNGSGYLSYDANGGEFTPMTTNLFTGKVTMQKPVMENKGFLGWSSTVDGDVEYKAGEKYFGESTILYAVYSDTVNVMVPYWPDDIQDIKDKITNVYFVNETQVKIDEKYNDAFINTIAVDLTLDNQGSVKGWLENDYYDNGIQYYNFYVASEGTTYLSNCREMFLDWISLEEIDFSNVDTIFVEDMSYMFSMNAAFDYGPSVVSNNIKVAGDILNYKEKQHNLSPLAVCLGRYIPYNHLTDLDLSAFNTVNVTDMSYMFFSEGDGSDCSDYTTVYLENINLSTFDTSKVDDMSYMFSGNYLLTELDLSHFDTTNVLDMNNMFFGCKKLKKLNINGFNTSKVEDMSYMFAYCNSVTELDLSNFDTRNVRDMESMFENCENLTYLNVENFDTYWVTTMETMFMNCKKITELNLGSFESNYSENISYMFAYCYELKKLDLSNFNFGFVNEYYNIFNDIYNLKTVYVFNDESQTFVYDELGYLLIKNIIIKTS